MEVEEWLHSLPLAPSSKAKLKCVLPTLYHHAIRYEWLTVQSHQQSEDITEASSRQRRSDSREEFQELVQQLSVRDRAMVLLIGSTCLRRSEMIARTWSDLNLRTMAVNVLRSCVRNRIGKTKTDASCRPVPLHPLVLNALLEWRQHSSYAADLDFLFPSVRFKGNTPQSRQHPGKEHSSRVGTDWSRWKKNRLAQLPPFTRDESQGARCRHKSCSGVGATLQLSHNA
jgi:integrase